MNTTEELIIRTVFFLASLLTIYIEYLIAKRLIRFGIEYFLERKSAWNRAYSSQNENYQTVRLTHEELDQISFALNTRIDNLKATIRESKETDGVGILGKAIETCISAQKQTTYAGQPEEYKFREGDR